MTTFEDQIDALLDDLSTATSEEIETALGKYDTRDLLTVVARRALIAGSGSTSAVLMTKVILTDAQIKALPTTTVELLPAPGAGKLYAVLAHIVGPLSGATYTNINAGAQFYGYSGDDVTIQNNFPAVNVLAQPNLIYAPGPLVGYTAMNAADDINQPVLLGIDNGGDGNLTGGDPANKLPISVLYAPVNTAAA